MTISKSQALTVGKLTTMLKIDFSKCIGFKPTGITTLNLSSNRNGNDNIVYDSVEYQYVGFDTQGFRSEINGAIPSPIITFDRASLEQLPDYISLWDQYVAQNQGEEYFDWRGATVEIFRTVNLDTNQQTVSQQYIVSQVNKQTETTYEVSLTVSLGIDKLGTESIQALSANRCALRYRRWNSTTNDFDYTNEDAGGCPYGNPTTTSNWVAVPFFGTKYFNNQDLELAPANKNLDKCSYSVLGCQKRFDPDKTGLALPFKGLYTSAAKGKGSS